MQINWPTESMPVQQCCASGFFPEFGKSWQITLLLATAVQNRTSFRWPTSRIRDGTTAVEKNISFLKTLGSSNFISRNSSRAKWHEHRYSMKSNTGSGYRRGETCTDYENERTRLQQSLGREASVCTHSLTAVLGRC